MVSWLNPKILYFTILLRFMIDERGAVAVGFFSSIVSLCDAYTSSELALGKICVGEVPEV